MINELELIEAFVFLGIMIGGPISLFGKGLKMIRTKVSILRDPTGGALYIGGSMVGAALSVSFFIVFGGAFLRHMRQSFGPWVHGIAIAAVFCAAARRAAASFNSAAAADGNRAAGTSKRDRLSRAVAAAERQTVSRYAVGPTVATARLYRLLSETSRAIGRDDKGARRRPHPQRQQLHLRRTDRLDRTLAA